MGGRCSLVLHGIYLGILSLKPVLHLSRSIERSLPSEHGVLGDDALNDNKIRVTRVIVRCVEWIKLEINLML